MQESRQHIKTRMLKNASKAWGYQTTESENNFDPLVSMLMTSCSAELEKISDEIHSSRSRVLERMVQMLSPDVLTGAIPAHGIVNAVSTDKYLRFDGDTQFYLNTRKPGSAPGAEPQQEIFFSPTSEFRINKATVRFMATGNELFSVSQLNKETSGFTSAGTELPASTLFLAIDEPEVSLDGSMFYFELRNEVNNSLFFHQLPKASWSIGKMALQHASGYNKNEISGERLDIHSILNGENSVYPRLKKNINAFYKAAFITINDEANITIADGRRNEIPAVITERFSEKEIKLLQKQTLRWIAIQFPETISNKLLKDLTCNINCFPVVNSRIHNVSHRLNEIINIIPLQTDDVFLDLCEVSDDEGHNINLRNLGPESDDSLSMLIRNGGVGRFDERDAASIIEYLIQLLRDDSAAFANLGTDFANSELKILKQTINKLEQQISKQQINRDPVPYLVIKTNKVHNWNNIFIQYRSTIGTGGNNLKAGTKLQVYKGGAVNNNAMFMTTTHGGRDKLNATDTVLAYKTALLSRDRLISIEDIKAFCHYQLGERASKVSINRGVMIHPDQKKGFIKTIDIHIDIVKNDFEQMKNNGELKFWSDNLTLLLEEKSVSLMPYRVYLQ